MNSINLAFDLLGHHRQLLLDLKLFTINLYDSCFDLGSPIYLTNPFNVNSNFGMSFNFHVIMSFH
jgi:hypothetical protein